MKSIIIFLSLLVGSAIHAQDLLKLIEKNNYEKLQKYFDKGGDINEMIIMPEEDDESNPEEASPLVYAVGENSDEAVQFFVDNKDKNPNFEAQVTEAFILSLSRGDESVTQLLFDQKPDLNQTCSFCHGANALMIAASYGLEDWYFKLKPLSNLQFVSKNNQNLLHFAAISESEKIFNDVLTIEGLDYNLKDVDGLYPVAFTVMNLELRDSFEKIVGAGADPTLQTDLLFLAIEAIHLDAMVFVFDNNMKVDLWSNDNEVEMYPLEYGAYELYFAAKYIKPENPDIFIIRLMDEYIKLLNKSDCVEDSWELILDVFVFSSLLKSSAETGNFDVMKKYLELVGKEQKCGDTTVSFPGRYYKKIVKEWGVDLVDPLIDSYEVDVY